MTASVADKLIPFMSPMILRRSHLHPDCAAQLQIPSALATIFMDAFTGTAAVGGFTGASLMYAARIGVARECSQMKRVSAALRLPTPPPTPTIRRAKAVGGFRSLFDTIIMCDSSYRFGDDISGTWKDASIDGTEMSNRAFSAVIPGGEYIISIGIVLFAFATIIAFGIIIPKSNRIHRRPKPSLSIESFSSALSSMAVATLDVVWEISDLFNGLMRHPEPDALSSGLVGPIVALTNDFFADPKTTGRKYQSYASLLQIKTTTFPARTQYECLGAID